MSKTSGTRAKLIFRQAKVEKLLAKALEQKIDQIGINLVDAFNDKLHGPRSGHEYFVLERLVYGFSSPFYTASSPEEYPAERTGNLLHSMTWYVTGGLDTDYILHFGTDISYAHEINAKRPFFHRGMMEELDVIQSIIGKPFTL